MAFRIKAVPKKASSVRRLLDTMPTHVAESFSDEQCVHLEQALGKRRRGTHSIDLKISFATWKKRYYLVLLGGYDKRQLSRSEIRLSRLSLAILISSLLLCCALAGVLLLYLLKSALGIDVFSEFSLGLWDALTV